MQKIERRRTTVKLYQGNYETELAELLDQVMAAQRAEDSAAGNRHGTKSKAIALAKKYDALVEEAEAAAVKVELSEISNTEWQKLADEHPPRDSEPLDKRQGVNIQTFTAALLEASLGESDIDLGELSRLHYTKLETAAWNLHAGDDSLPKSSLVSQLKLLRDPDSKRPSDSE